MTYAISLSIEANPSGAFPVLTQDEIWEGLVMKAENALPFVPIMESCKVIEKYPDGLLREISIQGNTMKERITFTPKVEVYFERVDSPENAGWISNVISESQNGLILTFTFALNFKGKQNGSVEEKLEAEKMRSSYQIAVENTLKKIRQMKELGEI